LTTTSVKTKDDTVSPPRKESTTSLAGNKTDSIQKDLFGMFKSLSSSLGLSDDNAPAKKTKQKEAKIPGSWNSDSTQETQKQLPAPPPVRPEETQKQLPPVRPTISPTDKERLSTQLQNSVSTVRSSRGKSINTSFPESNIAPPAMNSYCSPLTEQDLVLVLVVNDTPIYVDKSVADEGLATILSNEDAVERFTLVLQFLSSVFGLPQNSTQVYWDSDGSTVAFNRNRALFFNFRFYLGWHFSRNDEPEKAKTYHYWFMTFCHELAHNFHGPHDATHEYWMSSFAENYLGKLIDAMDTYGIKN
jgi:hypothetical protein